MTGNLGRDPSFHTTNEGTLVARFSLGEHLTNGNTHWHRVYTTKDRARQLQERHAAGTLGRGREVEVVGFVHVKSRAGKDGAPRTVKEVYAVAVMNR